MRLLLVGCMFYWYDCNIRKGTLLGTIDNIVIISRGKKNWSQRTYLYTPLRACLATRNSLAFI